MKKIQTVEERIVGKLPLILSKKLSGEKLCELAWKIIETDKELLKAYVIPLDEGNIILPKDVWENFVDTVSKEIGAAEAMPQPRESHEASAKRIISTLSRKNFKIKED